MEEIPRPQTYDINGEVDEGVEEEEEEKEKGYNADSEDQEGHYEAEYAEVDEEFDLKNEPAKLRLEEQIDQKLSLDHPGKGSQENKEGTTNWNDIVTTGKSTLTNVLSSLESGPSKGKKNEIKSKTAFKNAVKSVSKELRNQKNMTNSKFKKVADNVQKAYGKGGQAVELVENNINKMIYKIDKSIKQDIDVTKSFLQEEQSLVKREAETFVEEGKKQLVKTVKDQVERMDKKTENIIKGTSTKVGNVLKNHKENTNKKIVKDKNISNEINTKAKRKDSINSKKIVDALKEKIKATEEFIEMEREYNKRGMQISKLGDYNNTFNETMTSEKFIPENNYKEDVSESQKFIDMEKEYNKNGIENAQDKHNSKATSAIDEYFSNKAIGTKKDPKTDAKLKSNKTDSSKSEKEMKGNIKRKESLKNVKSKTSYIEKVDQNITSTNSNTIPVSIPIINAIEETKSNQTSNERRFSVYKPAQNKWKKASEIARSTAIEESKKRVEELRRMIPKNLKYRINEQSPEGGDEERIRQIVEAGDIEEMAALVLSGDGASLARQRSKDPDIQMFINNIPTYLNKIQRVHLATREGNLKELQSALDRRKFAVAHESVSPLRVTPLHVAVLYGRTAVVRFLSSRFPETMRAVDRKGRTPLHYAATLRDNTHFYNLLTGQGADKTVQDHDGKTAEYYLEHPEHFTHDQLLAEFEGTKPSSSTHPSDVADKVDNDVFSARRDNDDDELLNELDKRFKQIHNPFDKSTYSSVLGEFLSQDVFNHYRKVLTKSDHTLLDVIRPTVKRSVEKTNLLFESPIVLPDYESFVVFKDLVIPIIRSVNGLHPFGPLKPHPKPLFWPDDSEVDLESINLDPSEKVLMTLTAECSRNLKDLNFPCSMSLNSLEETEMKLTSSFSRFYKSQDADKVSFMREDSDVDDVVGAYCTLDEILEPTSEIYRQLDLNGLLDGEILKEKLRGKHWPSGRGVYIQPEINMAAWINVQEHLKAKFSTVEKSRGRIGILFKRLSDLFQYLAEDFEFKQDEFLGFLASDPQLVGNGLKFQAKLKLPHLGDDYFDLQQLCHVRGLTIEILEGKNEYSLKNKQSLGTSEFDSFKEFSSAVSNIVEMEKCKSRANSSILSNILQNFIKKRK